MYVYIVYILCICLLNSIFIINRKAIASNDVQYHQDNILEKEDKPQISIKLDNLKVNGVSTRNYCSLCPGDELELTYKISAEDLLLSDINDQISKDIILVLDTSASMNYEFPSDTTPSDENMKRIYALKQSAKQFINNFNNINNVRIGIIPFSYYSGYKNGTKPLTAITNDNKKSYEDYIDGLHVEGGTNQGDGLRKAGEMFLNSNDNAKKYIIFITDGEATVMTINDPQINVANSIYQWTPNVFTFVQGKLNYEGYKAEYIDKIRSNDVVRFTTPNRNEFLVDPIENLNYAGNVKYIDFNTNYLEGAKTKIATNYATQIGANLRNEIQNLKVFTIGCALKEDTVALAKEVNDGMNGDYVSASDSNTMKKIFDELADSILSDYDIRDVNLNIKLPSQFEISSNETSFTEGSSSYSKVLPNIKYHLSYDKTKYVAEPLYFSIKVKVKDNCNIGDVKIGSGSYVYYKSIGNDELSKELPVDNLRIINQGFPNIQVELQSPTEVYYDNSNIDIRYRIKSDSFSYEDIYGQLLPKNIYLVVDAESMNVLNTGNNIFNKIFSDPLLKLSKARYSLITYGDNNGINGVKYYNESYNYSTVDNEGTYTSDYLVDLLNKSRTTPKSEKNYEIVPALEKVEEIENLGRGDTTVTDKIDKERNNNNDKYILIVGKNNISDINNLGNVGKNLRDKGFKFITLNLGDIPIKDSWKTEGGYTSAQEGLIEANNNLKEVHYELSDIVIRSNETLEEKIDNNYFLKMNYKRFHEVKDKPNEVNQFLNQPDNFSLNWLNNDVSPRIAEKFRINIAEEISITDLMFKFNLQNKCDLKQEPQYTLGSINKELDEDINKVRLKIPSIHYRFNFETGIYENISFTNENNPTMTLVVKPKENIIQDFKFSYELTNGKNEEATFKYDDIIFKVPRTIYLDTPTIRLNKELPDLF